MTSPPSGRTWSAGSTTTGSCSGTTRRASTPRTSTASTCRVSQTHPGRQRRVRDQEPAAARRARRQVPRLPLGSGADGHRELAARPRARLRGLHRRPHLAGRSRISGSPPRASTRSSRRTRSSSTRPSACRASRRCLTPRTMPPGCAPRCRAVVLGQTEHSLLEITRTLLIENAKGQHAKYDALVDYGLDDFYWRGVARSTATSQPSPSIDDFVLWIFRQAIDGFESDRPGGLQNIQLDFASLRNDRRSQDALATLAKRAAARPRLRERRSRTRASATWWRSTCSRRPTSKIISDLARRSPSRPSPPARSPRWCARARAASGSTATASSTRRSAAPRSCWPS